MNQVENSERPKLVVIERAHEADSLFFGGQEHTALDINLLLRIGKEMQRKPSTSYWETRTRFRWPVILPLTCDYLLGCWLHGRPLSPTRQFLSPPYLFNLTRGIRYWTRPASSFLRYIGALSRSAIEEIYMLGEWYQLYPNKCPKSQSIRGKYIDATSHQGLIHIPKLHIYTTASRLICYTTHGQYSVNYNYVLYKHKYPSHRTWPMLPSGKTI